MLTGGMSGSVVDAGATEVRNRLVFQAERIGLDDEGDSCQLETKPGNQRMN